jgi:putative peptide zinc metalloprotease protein
VRHRLVVLLVALAAILAPASAAHADDTSGFCPSGANCAVAINTQNNSSLFAFAFAVRHVLGGVVDQENAAVAYSSCESCQTTAIAIEIVLVEGDTTNVSPQNVAVAVNSNCNLCDTFATAYQFVISTGGPVRFTRDGRKELHDIRKEIESWAKQHLTNEQMRALLPGVIDRLKTVLATQLVQVGNGQGEGGDENSSSGNHDAQPNAPPQSTPTTTTETGQVQTTTTAPTDTSGISTTAPTTTAPTTSSTTPGDTTTTTP